MPTETKLKPIKEWSYSAKIAFIQSMTFLSIILLITPAWALTGEELDALVPKIIQAESSGDPNAVGDGGKARGLCQIQKSTWARFSKYSWDDAFDPEKNIQVGRHILEAINDAYLEMGIDPDTAHVAYSYNSGRYTKGNLPNWTKHCQNKIYRGLFNEKA